MDRGTSPSSSLPTPPLQRGQAHSEPFGISIERQPVHYHSQRGRNQFERCYKRASATPETKEAVPIPCVRSLRRIRFSAGPICATK